MFYKKKKKTGRIVVLLCVILLFAGFTYGYMANNKPLNRPQDISKLPKIDGRVKNNPKGNDTVNQGDIDETPKSGEKDIHETLKEVNEESEIVFNTYYLKTGKIETKKIKIPITVVGASLNEFKSYIESNYSDWKINSISTRAASLFKQVDAYNPNYFIIQNKDGYIAVYKINGVGEKELYEETDISISILSEMDKKKLDEGIIAKSLEELYKIIEDYSS